MKLLITLLTILSSFYSLADAWDNLTLKEAQNVVKELEKNPYIFDYCDCCDYEGEYASSIEFIKVKSTEIVKCDWNPEMYSIKITSELISSVQFNAKGANIENMTAKTDDSFSAVLYMNYTWGLNPTTKKATPFFNIVDYFYYGDDSKPCLQEFDFPTPKQLKKVKKIKGYKKWWKANVRR